MTPSPPIRVVLVDDHAVVRAGLQYFLASTSDIVVVGEAGDGAQALVVVNELQPDVVVLDLMMPKVDGITALTQLHEGHPQLRVLMLTSFVEGPLIQQALQLGACGYLLKDAAGEELAAAIRTAYAGRSVLDAAATQALIRAVSEPPTPGGDLTEREREVLGLLVSGRSNKHIGVLLDISRNTVRHHVQNILRKLGAANRTDAVGKAVQYGLVPPADAVR